MRYGLCKAVSFCWVGGRAVVLDLRRDRYFCLGPHAEEILRALIASGGEEVAEVDHLVRLGLVESVSADGSTLRPAEGVHARVRASDVAPSGTAVGPSILIEVAWRLRRARAALKTRPLADVLEGLRARRSFPADAAGSCDSLAAQFNAARRRLPYAVACLPDALALLDFLAVRRAFPALVFGVKLAPFAAHCWVQSGEVVLNETLDNALVHTPILAF